MSLAKHETRSAASAAHGNTLIIKLNRDTWILEIGSRRGSYLLDLYETTERNRKSRIISGPIHAEICCHDTRPPWTCEQQACVGMYPEFSDRRDSFGQGSERSAPNENDKRMNPKS